MQFGNFFWNNGKFAKRFHTNINRINQLVMELFANETTTQ